MSSQEAWDKFVETGRVDYYLLSRGINIYADGKFPREVPVQTTQSVGGGVVESDGYGHRAESSAVGRS